MKFHHLFSGVILFLLIFTSCNQEGTVFSSSDEGLVSATIDTPTETLRPATALEVEQLQKDHNLSVVTVNGKVLACRWSDDLQGTIHGVHKCDGRCGVVTAPNNRIGIGCFDANGNIISSGSYRDRP